MNISVQLFLNFVRAILRRKICFVAVLFVMIWPRESIALPSSVQSIVAEAVAIVLERRVAQGEQNIQCALYAKGVILPHVLPFKTFDMKKFEKVDSAEKFSMMYLFVNQKSISDEYIAWWLGLPEITVKNIRSDCLEYAEQYDKDFPTVFAQRLTNKVIIFNFAKHNWGKVLVAGSIGFCALTAVGIHYLDRLIFH